MGKWSHALQDAFYENQEVFNVMFSWADGFDLFVFRLGGSVEALTGETDPVSEVPDRQR